MKNLILAILWVAIIYGLYRGIPWLLYTIFNKGWKTANRISIDVTERGKNRKSLREAMINFIDQHGGLEYVVIRFKGYGDPKEKSYISYAADFSVFDKDGLEHRFNFRDHGYDFLSTEAGLDIFERLCEHYKCHWYPYYKEVVISSSPGSFISYNGKLDYVNGDSDSKKILASIGLYSDHQWKLFNLSRVPANKTPFDSSKYKQL